MQHREGISAAAGTAAGARYLQQAHCQAEEGARLSETQPDAPKLCLQVRLLQTDIRRALRAAEDGDAAAEAAHAKAVLEGHGPGGDLRKLLKQPAPALLRMLLGPKVNVVALQVPRPAPPCLDLFQDKERDGAFPCAS